MCLHGGRFRVVWEFVNSGLDYWYGLLDWTTGLTFDFIFTPNRAILYRRRESEED